MRTLLRRVVAGTSLALAAVVPTSAHASSRYLDPIFSSVAVGQDVIYGSAVNVAGVQQDLQLNVYSPVGDTDTSRSAIVFAHGGGFANGSRNDARIVSLVSGWAKRGYVVVNIDYRLRPGITIPQLAAEGLIGMSPAMADAQHDMQAAVRWMRINAVALGINPAGIVAAGESAGAITAWQTGINADDPGTSGNPGPSSAVSAVVSLWGAAEPPHIDAGAAPVLDMHGIQDTTVPEPFATQACALMIAHGNVCEKVLWPSEKHAAFGKAEDIWASSSNFICRYAIVGCIVPAPQQVEVR